MDQSTTYPELNLNRGLRHDNVGRLLMEGWGYFEVALMRRIHESGFTMIRRVHFKVLRHLDLDGTRIVELASRAGITKGSMGQIVKECEQLGLVTLHADPRDARAKVVAFAEQGVVLMGVIRNAIMQVQAEMMTAMGEEDGAVVLRALQALRVYFAEKEGAQAFRD